MPFNTTFNSGRSKNQGVGSKIGTSLFFSFFMGMGLLFLGFMFRDLYRDSKPYFWDEAPCKIISSSIVESRSSGGSDQLKIQYSYTYKKRKYSSHKFSNKGNLGKSSEVRRWKNKYRKGAKAKCYVNPSTPSEAVIQRNFDWGLLPFCLIPLIFVGIGLGGIIFTWKKKKAKTAVETAAAIAGPTSKRNQKALLVVFFSVFFLAGSGFGWMMLGRPLYKIEQSKDWKRVPCVITSSRVKSSSDSDGTTYSVDMAFRYKFDGVTHVSGTYDFMTGSDSDGQSKYKVIKRYPVGTSTYCYVNPENPSEAVISREYNGPWWGALLVAIFIVVGAGGVIGTLFAKKRKHVYQSADEPNLDTLSNGETVLKVKSSPMKNFIGILFIAAFWNGIVSIFVSKAVKSWGTGHIEWFLSFFMIPFVLIGLALIGGVIYCFIALFNSKVTVSVSNANPRLGEKITLTWRIANSSKVDNLKIYLQGEESAIYNSGGKNNSRTTKTSIFEQITVMDTDRREAIHAGKAMVAIPQNTMHSFDASNTKITWQFVLHGDIKRRPDIKGEYVINVLPLDEGRLHKIMRSAENTNDGEVS